MGKEFEVFIIWNKEDERPSISGGNYGVMEFYLTLEQAQASLKSRRTQNELEEFSIKQGTVKLIV